MKKINCMIIVQMMVLFVACFIGSVPTHAQTNSGYCGDNVTWQYIPNSKTLVISGTGDMYDYEKDDITWDITAPYHARDVKNIIIKEGVTRIGNWAFGFSYNNVQSAQIPSTVKTIGMYAFYSCSKLKSISLPYGIKKIEERAFSCSGLRSIKIPSSVLSIDECAFSCDHLSKITLSKGLKTIGNRAFVGTRISSITIPSSIKEIKKYAFLGCKNLKKVYIKGKKTGINKDAFAGDNQWKETNANVVIYGYKASTAEKMALAYKMGFRTFGSKIPSKTKIISLSSNKKMSATVLKYKKVSKAYKYEIQISKSSEFKSTVKQAFTTKTSISLNGLGSSYANRNVYIRVRVYKKTKGKISVSDWSKSRKVKMKS